MNILITGGAGFIGTNCAIHFTRNKNNQVTIVDNLSRPGVKKNLIKLLEYKTIRFIKSNVNNIKNYSDQILSADAVIHLAGQTAVTKSIENPVVDFQSNLNGTFTLLEAIRKNNPQSIFIYASTNKVYGDHPRSFSETDKLDFISPYGCSKGAADMYSLDYARIYGLQTVVFRQSCIYGPWQIGVEDQGWVAHFSKQFLLKKPITIFGDGKQVRDLLYIDDLIEAYCLAIKHIDKIKGQAFNIGGGIENAYSLHKVIRVLENMYQYKVNINYSPVRLGDQKYYVSDNKKINKWLKWTPKTGFPDGIKKMINWQKIHL